MRMIHKRRIQVFPRHGSWGTARIPFPLSNPPKLYGTSTWAIISHFTCTCLTLCFVTCSKMFRNGWLWQPVSWFKSHASLHTLQINMIIVLSPDILLLESVENSLRTCHKAIFAEVVRKHFIFHTDGMTKYDSGQCPIGPNYFETLEIWLQL